MEQSAENRRTLHTGSVLPGIKQIGTICFLKFFVFVVFLIVLYSVFCIEKVYAIDGYTQLEYITATGGQIIRTGIYANNNTAVETKFINNAGASESSTKIIIADAWNSSTYQLSIVPYTRSFAYIGSLSITRTDYWEPGVLYTVYMDKNTGQTVNGVTTQWTGTANTFTSKTELTMFGVTDADRYASATLFYLKIWKDGVLVRDYVPVRRDSDGVLGMYDMVSRTFFTNAGSGEFIVGSVPRINFKWDGVASTPAFCNLGSTFIPTDPEPRTGYVFTGWKATVHRETCGIENKTFSNNAPAYTKLGLPNQGMRMVEYGLTPGSGEWVRGTGDGGFVYGIANCNNTSTGSNGSVGRPTVASAGLYCWCKLIGFSESNHDHTTGPQCTVEPESSYWVLVAAHSINYNCQQNCVRNCYDSGYISLMASIVGQ